MIEELTSTKRRGRDSNKKRKKREGVRYGPYES
jgi:hypothetical protein